MVNEDDMIDDILTIIENRVKPKGRINDEFDVIDDLDIDELELINDLRTAGILHGTCEDCVNRNRSQCSILYIPIQYIDYCNSWESEND
jgi:hypothetical protein